MTEHNYEVVISGQVFTDNPDAVRAKIEEAIDALVSNYEVLLDRMDD